MTKKVSDEEEKLLGDHVEEFLKKVGADKLAAAFEEMFDKDCGCEERKKKLNETHKKWKNKRKKDVRTS